MFIWSASTNFCENDTYFETEEVYATLESMDIMKALIIYTFLACLITVTST